MSEHDPLNPAEKHSGRMENDPTGLHGGDPAEQPQGTPVEEERHPAVESLRKHFTFGHLPPHLAMISAECGLLAHTMLRELPDGPELATGLRKLLEAKDCFVRAAVEKAATR